MKNIKENLTGVKSMDIGTQLKFLRNRRGWTMQEVADRIGKTILRIVDMRQIKENQTLRFLYS